LKRLAKDLSDQLGRGFSRTNLIFIRLCYLKYSNINDLSHQLTWEHLKELLKIDHDLERQFYEKQAIVERWTVRDLKRQKSTALFLRIADLGLEFSTSDAPNLPNPPPQFFLNSQLRVYVGLSVWEGGKV
jgi:heme oxygenase